MTIVDTPSPARSRGAEGPVVAARQGVPGHPGASWPCCSGPSPSGSSSPSSSRRSRPSPRSGSPGSSARRGTRPTTSTGCCPSSSAPSSRPPSPWSWPSRSDWARPSPWPTWCPAGCGRSSRPPWSCSPPSRACLRSVGPHRPGPVLPGDVEPFLTAVFGWTGLFNGRNGGVGLLLAGVILAIMILPTMVAISRDVLVVVPNEQVEGAMALGATRWQVLRKVVVPGRPDRHPGSLHPRHRPGPR